MSSPVILADGVNPNYVPEPITELIPAVGGFWNDDCPECNEDINVDEVYLNTVLEHIEAFLRKGNSGEGRINITGVMNVTVQVEIL